MPRSWVKYILQLALVCGGGLAIGALYGQPLVGGLLAALLLLGWQVYWLFRLERWLQGERMLFLPEGSGIWPAVFARINFIRGRGKTRSKRFKALIKQMRQATRSFPDGGIILGQDNDILTMNRVAEQLLGLKRKQDRGVRIENLVRDPDFVDYMRGDYQARSVEVASPANGGCWLEFTKTPYGLDQKLLLVRDVTQQHKANDMRRDFVANASHELRTPLTVITGYLEALADDPGLSQDLRVPIDEMQRQSDRMRVLVDELLRLSELESEGRAPEDRAVNISAIINTARQEARVTAGCPATVEVEILTDADLCGDAKDIQSVVSNLVSNAVRYTPEDGSIVIRWETQAEGGRLSVIDTGAGIAPEHIPRLTERFYRVENGRERMGGEGGNGLGLAIVKHALNRHDATLEVDSTPGKGARFMCHFPSQRIATVA